ncbi:DUF5017 domain-containing protein [Pseudopedobacter beijingensis]|uniref:DUF5017 domain-containing protein n=1 Tax=Pseudopedobacter beijingensis TaxID=1207056 RepID=A0ABW4I6U7_9SPHI
MKTRYLGLMVMVSAMFFQSCDKLEEIDTPKFEAYVDKHTYTEGDTVRINFVGDVDYITLYTGKPGNDFQFKDKDRYGEIPYYLDFNTHARDGAQQNQMSVLVSRDFNGVYNYNNIVASNWIDITARFKMAPAGYRDYMSSGVKDVKDAIFSGTEDTAHVYFAIRQITKPQNVNGTGNLNRVQNFRIRTQADINADFKDFYPYTSFKFNQKGIFSSPNKQADRAGFEGTNIIVMRNNTTNPNVETQDWTVSEKMAFPRSVNIGPDWGLPVKSINDRRLDYYQVAYNEPGDYRIVILAFNANSVNRKEVVKEIEIKVLPK